MRALLIMTLLSIASFATSTPQRIYLNHADPLLVAHLLHGSSSMRPEISTILNMLMIRF